MLDSLASEGLLDSLEAPDLKHLKVSWWCIFQLVDLDLLTH